MRRSANGFMRGMMDDVIQASHGSKSGVQRHGGNLGHQLSLYVPYSELLLVSRLATTEDLDWPMSQSLTGSFSA